MKSTTIAAISTPVGVGGIAGIRISGDNAFSIAKKVFKPLYSKSLDSMRGYEAAYGNLIDIDNDNIAYDNGVCLVYRAPKSYTGEDVVEIFCHGGIFVAEKTLLLILKCGAAPASAGEFSKRAFLNGKMSLTQAESVMDIISANNDNSLKMAMSGAQGKLSKSIDAILKKLLNLSAYFGAWFDYPEEGEEMIDDDIIINTLDETKKSFDELVKTYHQGKLVKEGVPTVIVGKPNVGKSTLMNLLAKEDRSIVTSIPGTTRDVIEETVRLKNITLKLSDTAGIRETEDLVEQIGVKIAYKTIAQSSLILALFDASEKLMASDIELINLIKDKNVIAIVNKMDKQSISIDKNILEKNFSNIIYASLKQNKGILELENKILSILSLTNFDPMASMLSNQRQYNSILKANEYIEEAVDAIKTGFTWDMVSIPLQSAISELLELTGENASEEIVNNIFDNFCVGK